MGNNPSKRSEQHAALYAKFNDPTLARLDLRSKNLDEIPDAITVLTNLVWLNLPNNHLTDLPDHLFALSSLKTLRLLGNSISVLPETVSLLTNLNSLDLSKNEFAVLSDSFGSVSTITDLNLHWNLIDTVSPELGKLVNLKILNLSLNAISSLPDLRNFTRIETLDLSHNRLADIPDSCEVFTKLSTLNLAGNRLLSMSGEPLSGLVSLRTLDLQGNDLKSIPTEIGNLPELKYLRLRSNFLVTLPEEVTALTTLTELELSQNYLQELPEHIANLKSLNSFYAFNNYLEELPEDLSGFVSLRELGVSWNQLTSLPSSVGTLSTLCLLFANDNNLTTLEDSLFEKLVNLQEINFASNQLKDFPSSVGSIHALQKINVQSNELTSFPDTSAMKALSWLELGDNKFTTIPQTVLQSTNLTVLNLFGNGLTSVPAELNNLVSLKKLYLSYNKLTQESFPGRGALSSLSSLEELFLSGNDLPVLPVELCDLTGLTELCVSNCGITALNPVVIKALTKMKHLHLTNNALTEIPSEVCGLDALVELDLAHNQLTSLPSDLDQLTNLIDLDFSDNYIQTIPPKFELSAPSLRQFKAGYNRLSKLPQFSPRPADTTVWISASANPGITLAELDPLASSDKNKYKRRKKDETHSHHNSHGNPLSTTPSGTSPRTSSVPAVSEPGSSDAHRSCLGWAEMTGRRPDQQDTLNLHLNYRGSPHRHLLGVFDGHSGEKSAMLVANLFHSVVSSRLSAAEKGIILPDDAEAQAKKLRDLENRPKIRRGRGRVEEVAPEKKKLGKKKREKKSDETEENAVGPTGFLSEDAYIRVFTGAFRELHQAITHKRYADGAAALIALVEFDNMRLILSNSGDERALLVRGKTAIQLTTDHKPEEPSEKVRVYDSGGFVNEQKRVDGILSLSRALGDNDLQPHVTYEPEVFFVDLVPEDQFLILACDGLWDVVSNAVARELTLSSSSCAEAATKLRDYAHMLGTTDNISVVVYSLSQGISARSPAHSDRGGETASLGAAKDSSDDNKYRRRSSSAGSPLLKMEEKDKEGKSKKSSKGLSLPRREHSRRHSASKQRNRASMESSDDLDKRTEKKRHTKEKSDSNKKRKKEKSEDQSGDASNESRD